MPKLVCTVTENAKEKRLYYSLDVDLSEPIIKQYPVPFIGGGEKIVREYENGVVTEEVNKSIKLGMLLKNENLAMISEWSHPYSAICSTQSLVGTEIIRVYLSFFMRDNIYIDHNINFIRINILTSCKNDVAPYIKVCQYPFDVEVYTQGADSTQYIKAVPYDKISRFPPYC